MPLKKEPNKTFSLSFPLLLFFLAYSIYHLIFNSLFVFYIPSSSFFLSFFLSPLLHLFHCYSLSFSFFLFFSPSSSTLAYFSIFQLCFLFLIYYFTSTLYFLFSSPSSKTFSFLFFLSFTFFLALKGIFLKWQPFTPSLFSSLPISLFLIWHLLDMITS